MGSEEKVNVHVDNSAISTAPFQTTVNSICATGPHLPDGGPRLPSVKPREGRTIAYEKWYEAVDDLLYAHGVTPEDFYASPLDNTPTIAPNATRAETMRFNEACDVDQRWKTINTSVWWYVSASVDLTGPDEERDKRSLRHFFDPKTRIGHGRDAILWVCDKADITSFSVQSKLLQRLGELKLAPGSTRAQISLHCAQLLKIWCMVIGPNQKPNTVDEPSEYWKRLLASMPTRPEASLLSQLRVWLAGRITDGAADFLDADKGVESLLSHASTLGIECGKASTKSLDVVAMLSDEPACDSCESQDAVYESAMKQLADKVDSLQAIVKKGPQNGKPPWTQMKPDGAKLNDCDCCDAECCQSNQFGGVEDCASRAKSTVNLENVSRGKKRYCLALRAHDAANPGLKSLKGVKFRTRSKSGGSDGKQAGNKGGVRALMSVRELLGVAADGETAEFDAWLAEKDAEGPGVMALGACSIDDEIIAVLPGEDGPDELADADDSVSTARASIAALDQARTVAASLQAQVQQLRKQIADKEAAAATESRREEERRSAAEAAEKLAAEAATASSKASTRSAALQPTPARLPLPDDSKTQVHAGGTLFSPVGPMTRLSPFATGQPQSAEGGYPTLSASATLPEGTAKYESSADDKKSAPTGTVSEILASAIWLNERQLRKHKSRAGLLPATLETIGQKLKVALTAVLEHARGIPISTWFTTLLAAHTFGPYLKPHVRELMGNLVATAYDRILALLKSVGNVAAGKAAGLVTLVLNKVQARLRVSEADRIIESGTGRLAMIGEPSAGSKRRADQLEQRDDARLLLAVSDDGQRAIGDALAQASNSDDCTIEHATLVRLCEHVGITRPQASSLVAMRAVMARLAKPDVYSNNKLCAEHFGCPYTSFRKMNVLLQQLRGQPKSEPNASLSQQGGSSSASGEQAGQPVAAAAASEQGETASNTCVVTLADVVASGDSDKPVKLVLTPVAFDGSVALLGADITDAWLQTSLAPELQEHLYADWCTRCAHLQVSCDCTTCECCGLLEPLMPSLRKSRRADNGEELCQCVDGIAESLELVDEQIHQAAARFDQLSLPSDYDSSDELAAFFEQTPAGTPPLSGAGSAMSGISDGSFLRSDHDGWTEESDVGLVGLLGDAETVMCLGGDGLDGSSPDDLALRLSLGDATMRGRSLTNGDVGDAYAEGAQPVVAANESKLCIKLHTSSEMVEVVEPAPILGADKCPSELMENARYLLRCTFNGKALEDWLYEGAMHVVVYLMGVSDTRGWQDVTCHLLSMRLVNSSFKEAVDEHGCARYRGNIGRFLTAIGTRRVSDALSGRSILDVLRQLPPQSPEVQAIMDRLGFATVMAIAEFPPGTLQSSDDCVPALSDNGASYRSSCVKSLRGAVLETFAPEDGGSLAAANEAGGLHVEGSYIFVFDRFGADGSGERVARRIKYAPNLGLPLVIAESTEVEEHGYEYTHRRGDGRVMTTASGARIPLIMSGTKLGWLKLRPVTDPDAIKAAIARLTPAQQGPARLSSVTVIGDGPTVPTGMSLGTQLPKLKGAALLRHMHVVLGHPSLRRLLGTLTHMNKYKGLVTREDVEQFVREGCGCCESTKMRRRAFTLKTIVDKTPPPPGKMWGRDELKLRVPTADHGFVSLMFNVDRGSKFKIILGMRGQTADDYLKADNELRARVRPFVGEIMIIREDSHPTHRSIRVEEVMASSQTNHQQSPPYVHEGALAEHAILHGVPSANALLLGSPDLGESHMCSACQHWAEGTNDMFIEGTQKTPRMLLESLDEPSHSTLDVYGAAAKALVHPEARDSKYGMHAFPCVYTGPAFNSRARIHCSVWAGRYVDVDIGCVVVNPDAVVARSRRDHPSHQPYNQESAAAGSSNSTEVVVSHVPHSETVPPDDDAALTCEGGLPVFRGSVWVGSDSRPTGEYSIGLCSGDARPGDIAAWMHDISSGAHTHFRIDPVVGGYEHRVDRTDVARSLCGFASGARVVVWQHPCGDWSAARFAGGDGPKPIFTVKHPNGVLLADGTVDPRATAPLALLRNAADVVLSCLRAGGDLIFEHPVSQAAGSPFAGRGADEHSTIPDTEIFASLVREFPLHDVFADQGAVGAATRKTTNFKVTPRLLHSAQQLLGTLKVDKALGSAIGKDEAGAFRTRSMQVYTSALCQRLATVALSGSNAATSRTQHGGNEQTESEQEGLPPSIIEQLGNEVRDSGHPFVKDERVEVFWPGEQRWYGGLVIDVGYAKPPGKKKGYSTQMSPQIKVRYDDKVVLWHRLDNNEIRHETAPSIQMLLTERVAVYSLADTSHELGQLAEAAHLSPDQLSRDYELLHVIDCLIDVEDGTLHRKSILMSVSDEDVVVDPAADVSQARHWHCPVNERDFARSPQRDMWQTAKELKWSEYLQLNMFRWVPLSSVDRKKFEIFHTLWAYKIKLNSDLTFRKLNPRWCFKGGRMDRSVYKAHAETLRAVTFKIIISLKAGYWIYFCTFLIDCSNAFQATRTDDDPNAVKLYCWPAPGFTKLNARGERMVCEVNTAMQGRIDATRLFSDKLFGLLERADWMRSLWDPQLCIYHNSKLKNTSAPLSEILADIKGSTDTAAQQPPIGYSVCGWHVDDGTGLSCDVNTEMDPLKNRVAVFLRDTVQVVYATTMTGWHGNKALGVTLSEDQTLQRVNIAAPDAVAQLASELLKDTVNITPKHVMTKDFFNIPAGEVPPVGDPARETVLAEQALTRHGLGVCIWLGIAYPPIVPGTHVLCANMHSPHSTTLKCLRYQVMSLVVNDFSLYLGGEGCTSLEQPDDWKAGDPYGRRVWHYHFFSDANLDVRSRTGGVGMLAGGCIQPISTDQHLASPDAHTSEVVAGGTNLNSMVPVAGTLQELHILCGASVTMYFDSKTTVFVASSDASVKKSVWLIRRAYVLQDGVRMGMVTPCHLSERDMAADPFTKYLVLRVWARHVHYICNKLGPVPEP